MGESSSERAARKAKQAKQRKLEAQRIAAKEEKVEQQRILKEEREAQLLRRQAEIKKAKQIRQDIAAKRKAKKKMGIKARVTTALKTGLTGKAFELRKLAGQMGFDNTGTKYPMDVRFIRDFTNYTSGLDVQKATNLFEMAKNNGWTRTDIFRYYNNVIKPESGLKGAAKRAMLKLAAAFKTGPLDLPDISKL
jgi:hypothetical protein